jgi:hypothetical protein
MRRSVLIVIICLSWPTPPPARAIEGRSSVGLGAGITRAGDVAPAISLLRGTGAQTLWGVDVGLDFDGMTLLEEDDVIDRRPRLPDSLRGLSRDLRRRTLLLGLRRRQHLRSGERLTPFLDIHLAGTYNALRVRTSDFRREILRFGGEVGGGAGVEWFPGGRTLSIAAQSTILSIRLERERVQTDDPGGSRSDRLGRLTALIELAPMVYVRVYL